MKKITLSILFLLPFFCFSQDTLVKWTFPNNPDDSVADGGIAANLTMTISTQGGTNAMSFNNAGATTRSARATKWNTGDMTKYWQIKYSSTGYNSITLSSKQRSSSTGPRDFKVQCKPGYGGSWNDVNGGTVLNADNWTSGVLSNLPLPTNCDNIDTVYLRWIMISDSALNHAVVQTLGASNIDDIFILGTVITNINSYNSQHDVKLLQNSVGITLSSIETAKEIIVYDIIGNLVFRTDKPSKATVISTGRLNKGLYFIKILFNDNTVLTKKVSVI
jgi:hypothetical protein